ncbi:hypothetical protein [Microbacterium tumbae]
MQYLTLEIPVHIWQRVDGRVDDSMALDVVDAIMESVIAGSCLRDAGWRASAAFTGERDEFSWPPPDEPLPITLRRAHWSWTRLQLERWEPYETDGVVARARAFIEDAVGVAQPGVSGT